MPQLLLPGFPDGTKSINPLVSVLNKDKQITYFLGPDNYFSHPEGDLASFRFVMATLLANGHLRPRDVIGSFLGISRRTLANWTKQLAQKGAGSFFVPPRVRGPVVLAPEKAAECGRLLDEGLRPAEVARRTKVDSSTLRKALAAGRIPRTGIVEEASLGVQEATDKAQRSRQDAQAAEGMGTACTRADERMAAALGLLRGAAARFEACKDVALGGLLCALPALCENGLLSGLGKHLSLPKEGFYRAIHVLLLLGFMALGRIRRPEGLRHIPPGEMGKVLGLDRVPEVRTLREKLTVLAATGTPGEWMKELSRTWMEAQPEEAGYLYVDGHVRVYHGSQVPLPRRYVSRQRLCLKGTTDYWVNDALGRPFFVVSKAVTEGLGATLLDEIVPALLKSVPGQPSEAQLDADELLHRFVVIFDREGSYHQLLCQLWKQRIGAITYRKAVKEQWPEGEFAETEVPVPGGGSTRMRLASRTTKISAKGQSLDVLEVRRLTKTGHQTAIITTARRLSDPLIAGRMFARWCQENFFAYMMEHYDIDGLVQYGGEEIPGACMVVNPAWRLLDRQVKEQAARIQKLHAQLGAESLKNEGSDIQARAEWLEEAQLLKPQNQALREQRRATARKVRLSTLAESERPKQLVPLKKTLVDTVKMIAYRAETALVAVLRPHLAKEEEARALIRELLVSSADLEPNAQAGSLTVHVHRMASPVHDRVIGAVLDELTRAEFRHPETGARMIYNLT
jgi:hypothetical protein